MNCNFDKFRSVLSIYRIVIDSVLDSQHLESALNSELNASQISEINNKIVQELIGFFKNYESEMYLQGEDIPSLIQEGFEAVDMALNLVRKELPKLNLPTSINYIDSIFNDANFKYIKQLPSLSFANVTKEEETKQGLNDGSVTSTNIKKNVIIQGGSLDSLIDYKHPAVISSIVDIKANYYGTATSVEAKSQTQFIKKLYKILSRDIKVVTRDEVTNTLNQKIKEFKLDLLETLRKNSVLQKVKNIPIDIDNIQTFIEIYEDSWLKKQDLKPSTLISWYTNNDSKHLIDQYNAYVYLKNFDDVIEIYSSGLILTREDFKYVNTENNKYLLKSSNNLRTSWSSDENESVSAQDETSDLYRNYVQTFEKINKEGKVIEGDYLSLDQINYSFSKIKFNIDFKTPRLSVKKEFENFLNLYLTNPEFIKANNLRENDFRTILSLYANVYYDPSKKSSYSYLNDLMDKVEKNTDVRSLYPDFKNKIYHVGIPNLLDIITSNLIKVDVLNYTETQYSYRQGAYISKTSQAKLSDTEYFSLKNLGNIITTKKDNVYEALKSMYSFQVIDKLNGQSIGKHVEIQLNSGKTIYYNVSAETFYILDKGTLKAIDLTKENENSSYIRIPSDNIPSKEVFEKEYNNYSDYVGLVKNFDGLLNQYLTADDGKLLDIMKETHGLRHFDIILKLMSNFMYLVDVNVNTINGNIELNSNQISNKLISYGILPNEVSKVWDNKYKRFNLDLNTGKDKGILHDYAEALKIYKGSETRAVTKNSEGNMMPVYAISSAINNYMENVRSVAKLGSGSVLYNNFIKDNVGLIKRVEVRSTFKSRDNEVSNPRKMNIVELLKNGIMVEFLSNRILNNELRFQPVNFADKNRQGLLAINPNFKVSSAVTGITNKEFGKLTVKELQDMFFAENLDYMTRIAKNILNDFSIILDNKSLLNSYLDSTKVLKKAIENEGIQNINSLRVQNSLMNSDYGGDTLKKELEIFNKIANFKIDKNAKQPEVIQRIMSEFNLILNQLTPKIIGNALNDSNVNWYNELYFEKGTNQLFSLNETLMYYLEYFSSKNKYIKQIEEDFIDKLEEEGFVMEMIDKDLNKDSVLAASWRIYGANTMNQFLDPLTKNLKNFIEKDGERILNPILKEFLWMQNVVTTSFKNLTVGSVIGHPHKSKNAKPNEMIALRLIAQNKRMVKYQSTYHPYIQNTINGIPFYQNRFYVKDPSVLIYTAEGLPLSVDVADGGSLLLPSEVMTLNNSLLDQSVGNVHKSFGGFVDPKSGAATLNKHAAHGITNVDIKNSSVYQTIISKMLGRNFTNFNGNILNIDITTDFNGNKINIKDLFGEIAFKVKPEHNIPNARENTYLRLEDIVYLGNNTYNFVYNDSRQLDGSKYSKTEVITNLYDLWVSLGGMWSYTFDINEFDQNPYKNDPFDGFVTSDKSWEVLTYFKNSVGVWNTTKHSSKPTLNNISVNPKELQKSFNERLPLTINEKNQPDPEIDDVDAINIFQPLKMAHVGTITFNSGQKVGQQKSIDLSDLFNKSADTLSPALVDVSQFGIQLNPDHPFEGSEVTEPTQTISTLPFSGDTPEITVEGFKAISGYIEENLKNIIQIVIKDDLTAEEASTLRKLIRRQTLKSFSSEDLSGFANSIIVALKNDLLGQMKIPVSSPDMFSSLNTAISNFITAEGVKRKMTGLAGVAQPYDFAIKFRTIFKKGEPITVTESKYQEWKAKNPNFQETKEVTNINEVSIFDTIVLENGKRLFLDPANYVNFKRQPFTKAVIDLTASRPLMPLRHKFYLEGGTGHFGYFDLPSVTFRLDYQNYNKAVDRYLEAIKNLNYNYSKYELKNMSPLTPAVELETAKLDLKKKLEILTTTISRLNIISEFKDLGLTENQIKILLETFPNLTNFKPLNVDTIDVNTLNKALNDPSLKKVVDDTKDSLYYPDLTLEEDNFLSNMLNQRLNNVHNVKEIPLPLFFNDAIDLETLILSDGTLAIDSYTKYIANADITNKNFNSWVRDTQPKVKVARVEVLPGEIATAYPDLKKLGIGLDMDVSDVTVEFFEKRRQSLALSPIINDVDFYMLKNDGRHLHFVIKGSDKYEKLMKNPKLKEAKLDIENIDGLNYIKDPYGRKKHLSPVSKIYRIPYGNGTLDFAILNDPLGNPLDINKNTPEEIAGAVSGLYGYIQSENLKSSPYEEIVFNINEYVPRLKVLSSLYSMTENKNSLGYEKDEIDIINEYISNKHNLNKTPLSKLGTKEERAKNIMLFKDLNWVNKEKESTVSNLTLTNEEKATKIKDLEDYENLLKTDNPDPDLVIKAAEKIDTDLFKSKEYRSFLLTNISSKLKEARKSRFAKIRSQYQKAALRDYANFKLTLDVIGARIPGQDLQSYMGMKIVHFINNKQNVTYVSPYHQAMTGEDFDVDKVYLLFRMLNEMGYVSNWTHLWNDTSEELLRASLNNPIPDLKTRDVVQVYKKPNLNEQDLIFLTELILEYNKEEDKKESEKSKTETLGQSYARKFRKLVIDPETKKPSVDRINKISEILRKVSTYDEIRLSPDLYKKYQDKVYNIDFINLYNNYSAVKTNSETAMLNGIVNALFKNITDIRNAVSANKAMSFGELPDYAKLSSKNSKMVSMSPFNYVDLVRAQAANMIGKDAIGIAASAGLKAWSLISKYLEDVKLGKKVSKPETFTLLKYSLGRFQESLEHVLTGINFIQEESEYLYWKKPEGYTLKQEDAFNERLRLYTRSSTSGNLSKLLAAATDNAKELILDRINANTEVLPLYLAGLDLGMDLKSITYMMIHPFMDKVLKVASRDIFKNLLINLPTAISAVADKSIDTKFFMNRNISYNITKQLIGDNSKIKFKDKLLKDYLNDKMENFKELAFKEGEVIKYLTLNLTKEELVEIFEQLQEPVTIENAPDTYSQKEKRKRKGADDEYYDESALDEFVDLSDLSEFESVDFDDAWEAEWDSELSALDGFEEGMPEYMKSTSPIKSILYKYVDFNKNILQAGDSFNPNEIKLIRNTLNNLLVVSQDLTTIRTIAGINQGLANTSFGLYKFISFISNYIKENYTVYPLLGPWEKVSNDKLIKELFTNDKLLDHLKNNFISNSDSKKGTSKVNVIDIVSRASHIWGMLKLAMVDYYTKSKTSFSNRLLFNLLERTEGITLKNDMLNSINAYVHNLTISTVLSNLEKITNFTLRAGDNLDQSKEPLKEDIIINTANVEGREAFINWMDNTVIPNLKMGYIKNNNGELPLDQEGKVIVNDNLKTNKFIQFLTLEQKYISNENAYTYYKLPINMVEANTPEKRLLFDSFKFDFSMIANYEYDGKKLVDLFYLYNLIVNKGKVSNTSLNILLDSVYDHNSDQIMAKYNHFIAELDEQFKRPITITETIMDQLYVYGVAVKYAYVPKEINENSPKAIYVNTYNKDSQEWERKTYVIKDNKYVEIPMKMKDKYLNVASAEDKIVIDYESSIINQRKNTLARILQRKLKINYKPC